MDRHAYKVKLWLTSERAWHHHLVNIMKESKSAKPGPTTVAWQRLDFRQDSSDA